MIKWLKSLHAWILDFAPPRPVYSWEVVYRRFQTRRDKEGLTSLYKGRVAGSTLVVAVVEFKDMLTVYDNGDDGSRPFPDRMLRTGGREEILVYLKRFGIFYQTPDLGNL